MVFWLMMTASAAVDVDARYTVADPAVYGELALYPIVDREAPQTPAGDYGTLQEGLADGTLEITELDASGSVPELQAHNSSKQTVLLLAGEVITGGKQDRVVVNDTLVPAGKPVVFAVNCVEQGRWSAGNTGLQFGFGGKAELALKETVQIAKSQGATWAKVEELNSAKAGNTSGSAARQLAPSSGTYNASLSNPEVSKKADATVGRLGPALDATSHVVGVVVAVDGEIRGAEMFGHPGLFARHRDTLIRGFALDAASDAVDDRQGVPATTAAAQFVRDTLAATEIPESEIDGTIDASFEGEAVKGKVLRKEAVIHRSSYAQ